MVVILSSDRRQVLLLRREIFYLWDLPGGGIEANEDAAAAAVREAFEETGCEIKISRFVGRYIHQSVYGRGDQQTYAFEALIIGRNPRWRGLERIGRRWFNVAKLPAGLQSLQRQMIRDALSSATEPFSRQIRFPNWKLWPARFFFIPMGWIKRSLRLWERGGSQRTKKK